MMAYKKISLYPELTMRQELMNRFFRYVQIDTQSQEDVKDRYPSTEKQKTLGRLLTDEMKDLGLQDAGMDEYGIVMGTCPGNTDPDQSLKIPVIGFLSHLDTSPDVSGEKVKPILHPNFQGEDIVLSGDGTQVIRMDENPALKACMGEDIVTSDGTTLLGADDKAGIAEIMTMLSYLQTHPEIKHGPLRIAFTPDEEVGMGTQHFDLAKFGADYAYTVDGGGTGEIENETFNAAMGIFSVKGTNLHPGYAKSKLVNSIRIIADIVEILENDPAPETTEGREGFYHPHVIDGGVERTRLKVLLRDFETEGIDEKVNRLKRIRKAVQEKYSRAQIDLEIKHQYKNMRLKLAEDPRVVDYAMEAVRRTGLESRLRFIRGGTDGADLCYRGLLTPNIFTGGMNFHSTLEWIPVPAMEKSVETLVNLVQIWVEKSVEKS